MIKINVEEIVVLVASLILSFTSGGNNSAIGPAILMGSGIFKRKKAMIACALGILLGVILNATLMINYGSTLVITHTPEKLLPIMVSSIVTLIILSIIGVPTSVSQLVIISIGGFAIFDILTINWNYFFFTLASWIGSILAAIVMSAVLYNVIYKYISYKSIISMNIKVKILIIFMSLYSSYLVGANVVGFVISITKVSLPQIDYATLLIINGIAGALGLIIIGRRIFIEVGFRLSRLGRIAVIIALFSANLIIQIFTLIGIPISVTQTITGSLIGINVAKGSLRIGSSKKMFRNWIISPIIGTIISLIIYVVIHALP